MTREQSPTNARTFETSLWLPRPLEEVFAFFADARNLQQLTPPWLSFRILTEGPIEMRPGALIDYRIRLRGVPLRWRTEITDWQPPYRFVDEQLRGPYRLWRHEHRFEERDGGTVVHDRVTYRVPGGPLVDRLFVQRDIERIFRFRHEQLREHFGTGGAARTDETSPRAVVIGAGMGGMAAAAELAVSGVDVTLLEAGDRPGGKVSGHRWDGHTVDFAPHVFSMGKGGEVARIAALLGVKQEFVDDSPLAGVVLGERRFPFPARFRSLVDTARLVLGAGVRPWNWVGAGRHFLSMTRGGPDLAGEPGEITVREWANRYTQDRAYHQILNMFSILAFVVPYDRASAQEMAASIHRMVRSSGVGYPRGGLLGMTRRMVRGLEEHGVDVRYGHRVERIEVEDGAARAVWARGQRFEADMVFSNAGIRGTVRLVGVDAVGEEYAAWADSLEDSLAGIMVRYTLDRHVIDDRVLFVMPDITGDEFSEAVEAGEMLRLEPGFYVTVGSNFDPALAPPGGQSVVCGTLYYPESDREEEAQQMLARMERRLERLYPALAGAVVHRELVTMAGIGQVSGRGTTGEAIGVAQTVEQSGAGRPDFRTPVAGLYVVGADTGTRAIGTELAAGSGFTAAEFALMAVEARPAGVSSTAEIRSAA